MIKINKYENKELALEKILESDKDYIIIKHDFEKGEIIDLHTHDVDEYVIFNNGKCEVTLGLKSKIIEAKNYAVALYFPKTEKHGLKCLTHISYWVLRKTE